MSIQADADRRTTSRGAALQRRLGGPVGSHARRSGIWFNPAPWVMLTALVTWLVCLAHQRPCQQTAYGHPVDAYKRLCYSDLPITYQANGLATGQWPYRNFPLDHGVVTAAFMVVARWGSQLLGFPSHAGVSPQQELDASYAWLLVSAVLLFCCFLAMCGAHLLLGRQSAWGASSSLRGRVRSWDAVLVAGAPVVAAAGLVNWDLLAASLVAVALLAWAVRRPMLAGVLFGLATASKFYPVLIVVGLVFLCARANRTRSAAHLVIGLLAPWLVVNIPVMLAAPRAWAQWYSGWLSGSADLGSFWYLLDLGGVHIPHPGAIGALLDIAVVAWVAQQCLGAPRRPRVGQVSFLLVAGIVLTERGYPPQHVLWVLPLLVLARPVLLDWAAFCIAELLYFWAVWGHLDNATSVGGGVDFWYMLATLLRLGVLAWICVRVAGDIRNPWRDPVRTPLVDDPVGGVLDHAPDARTPMGPRPASSPTPTPTSGGPASGDAVPDDAVLDDAVLDASVSDASVASSTGGAGSHGWVPGDSAPGSTP